MDPPPPPPDVAQNDLMMRLGLLLGDRGPTSAPTTPVPVHASGPSFDGSRPSYDGSGPSFPGSGQQFPLTVSTAQKHHDVVPNASSGSSNTFSPMMSPKWSNDVPDGFQRDRHRGSFQKDMRSQGFMEMTSPSLDSPRSSCGPSPRMGKKFTAGNDSFFTQSLCWSHFHAFGVVQMTW